MAVPFNNNQPSLTRWPWAACHDLSEATGFSPTNPGSAGILDAGDPGDLGTPNLARWIPNMERIRWQWKKSLKKTEAKPHQQKLCFHIMIIYDYHVIWVWVKLRLPEEWMVTNKKTTWNAPWLTRVTARYIGDPSTPPIFHVASNHRENWRIIS
jgi:hypothetical protein